MAAGLLGATYRYNFTLLNGVAVTTGNGIVGTGVQRVAIASDNTPFAVLAAGSVAHAAADSGNPVKVGGKARTANPAAVTDGQRVDAGFDKLGRQLVVAGQVRELIGVQHTQIVNSSAETTIVTAIAATFCDLVGLVITNQSATAVNCTLKDSAAGTTRGIFALAANGGIVIQYARPVPQAAVNTAWTLTLSSAAVTVNVQTLFEKNL